MAYRAFDIQSLPEFDNHEFVSFFYDEETGLKGFIAIHNTNLGPATGGTRYWSYASEADALRDALQLSRAMTYKCALASVPFGGGKAVIMKTEQTKKSRNFLRAYAQKINLLGGNFSTGEDAGLTEKDIVALARTSNFINGHPNVAGSPSPWAALSVFYSLEIALQSVFGNPAIKGRSFAIKGIGHVGFELSKMLYKRGARILVADTEMRKVSAAKRTLPNIIIVSPSEIHKQKVDVYVPCAVGNEFNQKNIAELQCKIICGAANNQLTSPRDGKLIHEKKILYIPDYVVNAGGLINVVDELNKNGYNKGRVKRKVREIKKTVERIIALSHSTKKPTAQIADELAETIFSL